MADMRLRMFLRSSVETPFEPHAPPLLPTASSVKAVLALARSVPTLNTTSKVTPPLVPAADAVGVATPFVGVCVPLGVPEFVCAGDGVSEPVGESALAGDTDGVSVAVGVPESDAAPCEGVDVGVLVPVAAAAFVPVRDEVNVDVPEDDGVLVGDDPSEGEGVPVRVTELDTVAVPDLDAVTDGVTDPDTVLVGVPVRLPPTIGDLDTVGVGDFVGETVPDFDCDTVPETVGLEVLLGDAPMENVGELDADLVGVPEGERVLETVGVTEGERVLETVGEGV